MNAGTTYKQTELGLIPQDWEVLPLSQLFIFKNGLNKEKRFFGFGSPIINYMDVYRNNELVENKINGLVSVTKNEIINFGVKKGDVFFTRTSETIEEIGVSAVLLENIKNAIFSGFVLRARPINSKLEPLFCKYCFSTSIVRKEITSKSSYTTRALTSGTSLSKVFITVPPLAEQTAIANALSDVDNLIKGLEKLIAKKKLIKQGALQKLLKPKKGWVNKRLGDIADLSSGGTPLSSNKNYYGGYIPWVVIADMTKSNKYLFETEKTITDLGLQNSSAKLFKKGTLLFAMYASIGKVSISKIDTSCNQAILGIVTKFVNNEYLYYFLHYNEQSFIRMGQTGTQSNLSKEIVSDLEIPIPSIEEQEEIADILTDMDNEIELLQSKLNKYQQVKEGMMQNLLTGKIRLLNTEVKQVAIVKSNGENTEKKQGHNKQINEAVIISVLVHRYANEKFALSRFRYTKYLYLLHRHIERKAEGFLKKAAGPYNPSNRYGGPENIAIKNKYIQKKNNGFISDNNIQQAINYFNDWYDAEHLKWLDTFKYYKNDQLEVLTTVDMAVDDLLKENKEATLPNVKNVIATNKEWKPKLEKPFFNDIEIQKAINESLNLFYK